MSFSIRQASLASLLSLLALPTLTACQQSQDLIDTDAGTPPRRDAGSHDAPGQADAVLQDSTPVERDGAGPGGDTGTNRLDGGHSCGDGTCEGSETCETCPGDCGACARDGGTEYTLSVTFNGFSNFTVQDDLHVYLQDVTASNWPDCGGGNYTGLDAFGPSPGLIAGHTYAYNYWIDTSSFTDCVGIAIPPYYTHTFGPVVGDTGITVSEADPFTQ